MNKKICFFFLVFVVQSWSLVPLGFADSVTPVAAPQGAGASADQAPQAGNITLDFKEADITTVLRVLSLKSKMNIVAGPEVQGTVTIRLDNVPWEKALEVVLRTYDYVYERDENIIRVTTREKMAQEPVVTQTYILNYTKSKEVMESVKDMLTERGRIKTAERTNTLIVTDIPTNLYRIKEVIMKLDRVTPQAFIDSKIVKTDVGLTENLGIQWLTGGTGANLGSLSGSARPVTFPFNSRTGANEETVSPFLSRFFPLNNTTGTTAITNPADSRSFPIVGPNNVTNSNYQYGTLSFTSFSAVLQALRTRSNTKVVSNPRIVVLNNQAAKVQVGSDIPIPQFERNETTGSVEVTGFSYRNVGVVLKVTPHINSESEILVDLAPEVSTNAGNIDFGDFQAPSFNITTAITQVLISSGETIAIGGLMTDNVQQTEARVPYLSDIPLVGKMFRSKRQTDGDSNKKVETLFFVTVTTVDTAGQREDKESREERKAQAAKRKLEREQKNAQALVAISAPKEEKVQPVMDAAVQSKPSENTEPAPQMEPAATDAAANPNSDATDGQKAA